MLHRRACWVLRYGLIVLCLLTVPMWADTSEGGANTADDGAWVALDEPETLIVAGSWSGHRVNLELAKAFREVDGARVGVRGRKNPNGFEYLAKGEMDVLVYSPQKSVSNEQAITKAFGEKAQPTGCVIGQFVLRIVVHEKQPISKLTLAQLRDVFAGKITDWRQLGGKPGKISLVGEGRGSKSMEMMNRCVMGNTLLSRRIARQRDHLGVIGAVSKDPQAIGFYLDRRSDAKGVKAVEIEAGGKAVGPTEADIYTGIYPLVEDLWLYTTVPCRDVSRRYCDFAVGESGSKVARKWFLYTAFERFAFLAERRLAEMRGGKGPRLSIIGGREFQRAMGDLITDYVRAKEVIIPKYTVGTSLLPNVSNLLAGQNELFVANEDLASEPGLSQLRQLRGKWEALKAAEHVIGNRAVGIVVNGANKLQLVSLDALAKVYTGEVRDWLDIGPTGLDATDGKRPIASYGLYSRLPAGVLFDGKVLGKRQPRFVKKVASTEEVLRTVRAEPGAIGVVDLTQLSDDLAGLRILPIQVTAGEVVYPTATAIQDGKYPLAQPVYLYVHPKASETTKRFVEFIVTGGKSAANPYTDVVKSVTDTLLKNGLMPQSKEAIQKLPKFLQAAPAAAEESMSNEKKGGKKSGGW